MLPLIFVVGMEREARLIGSTDLCVIGARGLEAALAGGARGIVSFGLCGGLDPALGIGELLIGEAVVSGGERLETHHAWRERLQVALPAAHLADFAGETTIAASQAQKSALRERTGAAAVDLESAEAARAALRLRLPFAIVRAISDTATADLPSAAVAGFRKDGRTDVVAVLAALANHPLELPALVRTAGAASAALRTLARAAPIIRGTAP